MFLIIFYLYFKSKIIVISKLVKLKAIVKIVLFNILILTNKFLTNCLYN